MALRARCSGLILGLYSNSVIIAPSYRLKDHREHAGHETDQLGSRRDVNRHEHLLFLDHQVHQSSLPHDDLPCNHQYRVAEGYRGRWPEGSSRVASTDVRLSRA